MANARQIIIDSAEAFAELAELAGYASRMPELSVEIYRLIKKNPQALDCEVDSSTAETTGRVIARYKLPERFRVLLVALRAGDWKPDQIGNRSRRGRLRNTA